MVVSTGTCLNARLSHARRNPSSLRHYEIIACIPDAGHRRHPHRLRRPCASLRRPRNTSSTPGQHTSCLSRDHPDQHPRPSPHRSRFMARTPLPRRPTEPPGAAEQRSAVLRVPSIAVIAWNRTSSSTPAIRISQRSPTTPRSPSTSPPLHSLSLVYASLSTSHHTACTPSSVPTSPPVPLPSAPTPVLATEDHAARAVHARTPAGPPSALPHPDRTPSPHVASQPPHTRNT